MKKQRVDTPWKNSAAEIASRPKSDEPVLHNPGACHIMFQNATHHQNIKNYFGLRSCGPISKETYARYEEIMEGIYQERGWQRSTTVLIATFNPRTAKTPYG